MATDPLAVLVLGTSQEVREQLGTLLAPLGYRAHYADAVPEASIDDVAADASWQLVLLGDDVADGVRAGWLEHLRATPPYDALPILLLCHDPHGAEVSACLDAGADDYVAMPTRAALLSRRLAGALERYTLRAAQGSDGEREMFAKLERDVQIGRQIQQSFLPSSLPQPDGWEIAASFRPAREVAGDFYDSFYIWNRRRVALIVADVSDKGIPAALFMAIFRTLLRAGSLYGMSIGSGSGPLGSSMEPIKAQQSWSVEEPGRRPRKLPTIGLSQLESVPITNAYMAQTHGIDAYFVTLFFGILDPRTGDLLYVNGGHNPPVILREDGAQELLRPTGPAVGILPEAKFRYAHAKLLPGDVLFAYTDGVPEARTPSGAFYTDARMLSTVGRDTSSAAAVLGTVEDELQRFGAYTEQFDDITMMAVRHAAQGDSASADPDPGGEGLS